MLTNVSRSGADSLRIASNLNSDPSLTDITSAAHALIANPNDSALDAAFCRAATPTIMNYLLQVAELSQGDQKGDLFTGVKAVLGDFLRSPLKDTEPGKKIVAGVREAESHLRHNDKHADAALVIAILK